MDKKPPVIEGPHFTATHLGELANLDQYNKRAKVFLKNILNLTGMEISVNKVPAGGEAPFLHKHKNNEEVYFFVKGKGQFQVDGQIIDIQEGSVIRIAPEGVRAFRNNSTEDLYYICIQAAKDSLTTWTMTDGEIVEGPINW
ncbi:MAG: cupin [Bacillus thermozeamaize]|uniref:Cupin n=1 Tax=Bacillus thermozeamaize TaxID=230954 RepID=A0A1Y3PBV9_9BACI|nr:MAG: cupin [Bacillus thermozeamaize]